MRLSLLLVTMFAVGCRPPGWDKRDDHLVDAAGGPDGPTVDGSTDATAASCTKAFRLDGHSTATSVWLTGSFNMWAGSPPAAIVFEQGNDGAWTGTHTFAPGLHQYKFVVSGSQWIPDPTNPDGADDGFGGTNSLYTCVP